MQHCFKALFFLLLPTLFISTNSYSRDVAGGLHFSEEKGEAFTYQQGAYGSWYASINTNQYADDDKEPVKMSGRVLLDNQQIATGPCWINKPKQEMLYIHTLDPNKPEVKKDDKPKKSPRYPSGGRVAVTEEDYAVLYEKLYGWTQFPTAVAAVLDVDDIEGEDLESADTAVVERPYNHYAVDRFKERIMWKACGRRPTHEVDGGDDEVKRQTIVVTDDALTVTNEVFCDNWPFNENHTLEIICQIDSD